MLINDFINKVVISTGMKERMYLCEITSPYFKTETIEPSANGNRRHYIWPTINGNAFENGALVFEDPSLTKPFLDTYEAFSHSQDAYWETFGYWLRKD